MVRIFTTLSLGWCVAVVVSAASLRKQKKTRQDPDATGDEFEYGDKEMAVSQGDQSDFSLHQFLETDDGRYGSSTSDDDTGNSEIAKEHALAADDHFGSEDTPDTTDSFLQTKTRKQRKTRQDPDDSGDDFEYGDKEMAVSQGDQSDFSLHQFLATDDGRYGSSTSDDDSGNAEIAKEHALAADDHFGSEDTPDTTDSFIQTNKRKQRKTRQDPDDVGDGFEYGDKEMAVSQGDQSDFSLHQFLETDDGRYGSSTSDDDSGNAEIAKEHALAADDHFGSEDTPDTTDSFIQTNKMKSKQPDDDFEYGDREMAVSQGDSSDFSIHQFLTHDDGREGSSVSDDDTGNAEIARSAAVAADDHFNSEDTPDTSDSFAQMGKSRHAK